MVASNGPGEVRTVATSSGGGSIRRSVLHQKGSLGQRDASTHPFDPGTPKYSMLPLRPENRPGTVLGGYKRKHDVEQGGGINDSSSNSSSTAPA